MEVKSKLFKLDTAKKNNDWVRKLEINRGKKVEKLKIAVANISIDKDSIKHEYLRKPVIKPERRKVFNTI